jgi:hypothetical protein
METVEEYYAEPPEQNPGLKTAGCEEELSRNLGDDD